MENYSLLMGDNSVDEDGDEDGSGVDGEAFRGHFPVPAACRTETHVPRSWLRDGGGWKFLSSLRSYFLSSRTPTKALRHGSSSHEAAEAQGARHLRAHREGMGFWMGVIQDHQSGQEDAEEAWPAEEAGVPEPLMKNLIDLGSQFIGFRDEATALKEALRRAEERVDALAAKLELSEKAREKAEKDAAAVEGLRQRLQTAEDALSDKVAEQIERENAIISCFDTQNRRFTRRMGEVFTLHEEAEDRLLDALSILELNDDLVRTNISNARTAFTRLFPHFFPKETPEIFSELVQRFLGKEDLVLAYRQDSLKIGVEGTIALVTSSEQNVDWAKAGSPKGMNKEKWKALMKDAKPQLKKILAFLNPKSAAFTSTARTEVK
ncbi:hypothetical protein QYE76_060582 [Lolium multiflorum]|uniref:Uncharacterized protein n=1 Tax=Lolium multiflorum TaxID=4521 RepID=A0AAD8S2F7_LOLMU|nr:hypothetical protein QYE76_060582 [Lolium multiflorum]